MVSVWNHVFRVSSLLNCSDVRSVTWPLSERIQPLFDSTTVMGSRSTSASARSTVAIPVGMSAKVVRRLPILVSAPNFLRTSRISQAMVFHCCAVSPSRPSICFFSSVRSANSLRNCISSSLRNWRSRVSRMVSACKSVSSNRLISAGLGSSSVRIMRMTSSRFRNAISRPPKRSKRRSISASRKRERRCNTTRRWSSQICNASARPITRGTTPSTSTFMFMEKRVSSSVSLNSVSISTCSSTARLLGSRTTRISSADSSRTSARMGTFLSLIRSASASIRRPFCTR